MACRYNAEKKKKKKKELELAWLPKTLSSELCGLTTWRYWSPVHPSLLSILTTVSLTSKDTCRRAHTRLRKASPFNLVCLSLDSRLLELTFHFLNIQKHGCEHGCRSLKPLGSARRSTLDSCCPWRRFPDSPHCSHSQPCQATHLVTLRPAQVCVSTLHVSGHSLGSSVPVRETSTRTMDSLVCFEN